MHESFAPNSDKLTTLRDNSFEENAKAEPTYSYSLMQ